NGRRAHERDEGHDRPDRGIRLARRDGHAPHDGPPTGNGASAGTGHCEHTRRRLPSRPRRAPAMDTAHDGQKDFDFLIGSWKVRNRRPRPRPGGARGWHESEAPVTARPVGGALAKGDEWGALPPWGPTGGLTVRLYDPPPRQWRLHWANRANGIFDAPMVGR